MQENPDNEYLQITSKPAWDLLHLLNRVSPDFAHYRFREACGKEPCPHNIQFTRWLSQNQNDCSSPISTQGQRIAPIDLSISSLELGNNIQFSNPERFQRRVNDIKVSKNAKYLYGGYNEYRPIYIGEQYQKEGLNGIENRTVHLGIDVWSDAGTNVYAVWDGEVICCIDDAGDKEYGPLIILKHQVEDGLCFYTLYGHLNRESLKELYVGKKISKAQKIAELGTPLVNGGWPSHLHFQIILDMLNCKDDFPGVAYPTEIQTFLSICPDPNRFFKFQSNSSIDNPSDESILERRRKVLGKSLSTSYQDPPPNCERI